MVVGRRLARPAAPLAPAAAPPPRGAAAAGGPRARDGSRGAVAAHRRAGSGGDGAPFAAADAAAAAAAARLVGLRSLAMGRQPVLPRPPSPRGGLGTRYAPDPGLRFGAWPRRVRGSAVRALSWIGRGDEGGGAVGGVARLSRGAALAGPLPLQGLGPLGRGGATAGRGPSARARADAAFGPHPSTRAAVGRAPALCSTARRGGAADRLRHGRSLRPTHHSLARG
mmetsp:Transcript_24487/g.79038  ORF Transcript_24487/g.79038 Transcript_24487/m.79038 type:complete len:225 (-) Transcript_24487:1668-2342(-)